MGLTSDNLYELVDWGSEHTNVEAGGELVDNLELDTRDITESLELAKGDGAIDGALYHFYHKLLEMGYIHHIPAIIECESLGAFINTTEDRDIALQAITTVDAIKLIMYYCFVLGSETMKSKVALEQLWSRSSSDEENKDGVL